MGMDLSISIPSDEFKMVFSFQINLGYMALFKKFKMVFSFQINLGYMALFKKNEVDGTLQMLD